tara:strand:- start:1830 stop:2075 length:246 start_codon:yes stop_codon:yes gene_type:complete
MKAQKPLTKPQVDLAEQETMKCDSCGNYLFIVSYVIKKISAIVSPTGQAGLVPVQVYSCGNCGEVPSQLLEGSGLNVKEKE